MYKNPGVVLEKGIYLMNIENLILANKTAIIRIIKLALTIMNSERKQKHSNYNLAQDFKDNLDKDLKDFCESQGFEYKRSGQSQMLIIAGTVVKIKMHTSLNKLQRDIIEKAESKYIQLKIVDNIDGEIQSILPHNWEIGIELSKNRKELEKIRLADFDNGIIKSMYSKVAEPNIKPANTQKTNKFTLKRDVKELR